MADNHASCPTMFRVWPTAGWRRYKFSGTAERLRDAGILRDEWMPQGRKRVRSHSREEVGANVHIRRLRGEVLMLWIWFGEAELLDERLLQACERAVQIPLADARADAPLQGFLSRLHRLDDDDDDRDDSDDDDDDLGGRRPAPTRPTINA
jgi:hypothetical protein